MSEAYFSEMRDRLLSAELSPAAAWPIVFEAGESCMNIYGRSEQRQVVAQYLGEVFDAVARRAKGSEVPFVMSNALTEAENRMSIRGEPLDDSTKTAIDVTVQHLAYTHNQQTNYSIS